MQGLLIIDVQNDYFPGGKAELVNADKALENIRVVLELFRAEQLPVIFIQHINTREGAGFFLPETDGAKINPGIAPLNGEAMIIKHAPNSFHHTGLAELIQSKGIDKLVVCGMMTHMCVDTTVRAAKDYSIPVTLLYDACATKDLTINGTTIPAQTVHDAYMAGLNGMFAEVVETANFRI